MLSGAKGAILKNWLIKEQHLELVRQREAFINLFVSVNILPCYKRTSETFERQDKYQHVFVDKYVYSVQKQLYYISPITWQFSSKSSKTFSIGKLWFIVFEKKIQWLNQFSGNLQKRRRVVEHSQYYIQFGMQMHRYVRYIFRWI